MMTGVPSGTSIVTGDQVNREERIMRNMPAPVAARHQHNQNTEPGYSIEIDFEPEPELFDPAELQKEIWAAIHPST